jgi:hypothetical protein
MNTSFCTHCGAKHTYNFAPPKFCSNCGESVSGKPKASRATASRRRDEDGYDDDDELSSIDYVPDLDNIKLDVEQEKPLIQSLGAILGQTQDAARPIEKRSFDLSQRLQSRGR